MAGGALLCDVPFGNCAFIYTRRRDLRCDEYTRAFRHCNVLTLNVYGSTLDVFI